MCGPAQGIGDDRRGGLSSGMPCLRGIHIGSWNFATDCRRSLAKKSHGSRPPALMEILLGHARELFKGIADTAHSIISLGNAKDIFPRSTRIFRHCFHAREHRRAGFELDPSKQNRDGLTCFWPRRTIDWHAANRMESELPGPAPPGADPIWLCHESAGRCDEARTEGKRCSSGAQNIAPARSMDCDRWRSPRHSPVPATNRRAHGPGRAARKHIRTVF